MSEYNINAAQQKAYSMAYEKFSSDVIDVEVQMLSKLSTAVKLFELKTMGKKE